MTMIDSETLRPLSLAVESAQEAWYAAAQFLHEAENHDAETRKFALQRVEAAEATYHDLTRDLANAVRRLLEQLGRLHQG